MSKFLLRKANDEFYWDDWKGDVHEVVVENREFNTEEEALNYLNNEIGFDKSSKEPRPNFDSVNKFCDEFWNFTFYERRI